MGSEMCIRDSHGADRVAAVIFGAGVAHPVAEKTGNWIGAAEGKRAVQDIDALIRFHRPSQVFGDQAEDVDVALADARLAEFSVGGVGGDHHVAGGVDVKILAVDPACHVFARRGPLRDPPLVAIADFARRSGGAGNG